MKKYTVKELIDIVKEEANIMKNKDVEKIADEIIDRIGEENIDCLDKFWSKLSSRNLTYVSSASGKRFFF